MKKIKRSMLALFFSMAVITVSILDTGLVTVCAAVSEEETAAIELKDVKDFEKFVENCQNDSWSVGKTVTLTADIDVSGLEFNGAAYFSGTFDGGGHTISHVNITAKGSDYGLFRYLGENAVVSNLKVSGKVSPSGSSENIGGIAGVNYGTINGCSFSGSVSGKNAVGAIAGMNKASGKIADCSTSAEVEATNRTGGIAGENKGLISGCTSDSSVNTEELVTTMDLGGIDIGTFNVTHNIMDRNDMGGIAGISSGIITECTNNGTIGYSHTGYNVGGIAGRQNGKVISCTNNGILYGRKDVGGIVGQTEPYIESEYLEDKVDTVQDSVKSINNTLGNMASEVNAAKDEAKQYSHNLSEQYKNSTVSFSETLENLSDSVGENNPEARQYLDNIEAASDEIDRIEGEKVILSKEELQEVSKQWQVINDNLANMRGIAENSDKTTEDFLNDISNQIKEKDTSGDVENLTNAIDSGIQTVTDGVSKITGQISRIQNTVEDTMSALMGEEEYIKDISSIKSSENTDGVIFECINHGEINGDLNVGGIAGSMNIEYDLDPEYDIDLTKTTNITLRTTVNSVLAHCRNYGLITAKKNCAGGIAGLQEIGLIYDSEGYGTVKSDTGDYVGGIVGNSASAVKECYSLCNIEGEDYCGGIGGKAYTIKDSISAPSIISDGEALGSIAGAVSDEGEVKGNYFVSDNLDGIDHINYAGVAEKISYEDAMQYEKIPEGFRQVSVTFMVDDEIIAVKTIPYNTGLTENDLPQIPEKDGYYAKWPDDFIGEPISDNRTVEAEYTLWTESIAGEEYASDNKTLFLTEGQFYGDSSIAMTQIEPKHLEGDIVYAYDWQMKNVHDKQYETVKCHFYVPESGGKNEVWFREQAEDAWKKAKAKTDGSYLVAEIPYEASFALVHKNADYTAYYAAGGAAVLIVFVIFAVRRYNKRKKKSKREE